ncbi:hypothetical protein MIND_00042400 [Mycena indigotica]|uniref:Mtf2-like C-terminal domain-containing protein n=1 Tax=Mycena indigotica TaxID=2126181 RepID=A0A8H6TGE9_9AGAR|nr:uncharacterized protein MIND_00042400 [Mycena indigotica]KAF7315280.1 hypothetical protein MIND_00042400 [Mycena indigotica]
MLLLRPTSFHTAPRNVFRRLMSYNYILVAKPEPSVSLITLNRPKALNALSSPLFEELNKALKDADDDDAIGAIVLTGSEKAFAAGADIKEMQNKTYADAFKTRFLGDWAQLFTIRKPIIAAVSGYALGGGCELALMCDIILASPTAKFGQPEINLGVIPGGGGSQRLAHVIGKSRTMELVLTGRNISAQEAAAWGMVSRVVGEGEGEVVREAVEMAKVISSKSQIAIQAAKEVVNAAYELNLAEGLRFERRIFHGSWDHVFAELKSSPPSIPALPGVGPRRPRRQTMTAQEMTAFNEIFNLIFESMESKSATPSPAVDLAGEGMGDLFSTLRKHSKRIKWTAVSEEALDLKRDEMDRCGSDQELLEWALRRVFGESQQYEKAFMEAKAADDGTELPMLQPPTYPHFVALLIRTFRDKYRDPHLALSIFDYARHLSIASYVFGCSTKAYNELIQTRWDYFRDLRGVHAALEEMHLNSVDIDSRTRQLAEKVRKDVGQQNLWVEENEVGLNGVWDMLHNIEQLAHDATTNRPVRHVGPWNRWKAPEGDSDMNWQFDKW